MHTIYIIRVHNAYVMCIYMCVCVCIYVYVHVYMYVYVYIYINLPDMSQLPTSPFPKRGTSGPGNVFSTLC